MATCGMYSNQATHALRVAKFAQEAVDAARTVAVDEDDASKGVLELRAGIHVGPLVASVVGALRPRFTLFGDTVNVANRIEGTSEHSRVNLSAEAATALRAQAPAVRLVDRGEVVIKGKGPMRVRDPQEVPRAHAQAGRVVARAAACARSASVGSAEPVPAGCVRPACKRGRTPAEAASVPRTQLFFLDDGAEAKSVLLGAPLEGPATASRADERAAARLGDDS